MKKVKQACGNCRFWQLDHAGPNGACLRFPPVGAHWPETCISNWCGEWKKRKLPGDKK